MGSEQVRICDISLTHRLQGPSLITLQEDLHSVINSLVWGFVVVWTTARYASSRDLLRSQGETERGCHEDRNLGTEGLERNPSIEIKLGCEDANSLAYKYMKLRETSPVTLVISPRGCDSGAKCRKEADKTARNKQREFHQECPITR